MTSRAEHFQMVAYSYWYLWNTLSDFFSAEKIVGPLREKTEASAKPIFLFFKSHINCSDALCIQALGHQKHETNVDLRNIVDSADMNPNCVSRYIKFLPFTSHYKAQRICLNIAFFSLALQYTMACSTYAPQFTHRPRTQLFTRPYSYKQTLTRHGHKAVF
jgi:hypothetical protein